MAVIGSYKLITFCFHKIVNAPVLSVKIKMVVSAPCVGLTHGALYVAGEDLSQHRILITAVHAASSFKAPGIVLCSPEVHLFKFINSFVIEQRISQSGRTIFRPEE